MANTKCQLCGNDSVCCPCVVAGLTAKAQAISNHEAWREGRKRPGSCERKGGKAVNRG